MIDLEKIMNMEDEINKVKEATNKELGLFFGGNIFIDTISGSGNNETSIVLKKEDNYESPFSSEQTSHLVGMFIDRFFHRIVYIINCALGSLGMISDTALMALKFAGLEESGVKDDIVEKAKEMLVITNTYMLSLFSALDTVMEKSKSISDSISPNMETKLDLSLKIFSGDDLEDIIRIETQGKKDELKVANKIKETMEKLKEVISEEEIERFVSSGNVEVFSQETRSKINEAVCEMAQSSTKMHSLLEEINPLEDICDCPDCREKRGESTILGERKPSIGSFGVREEKVIN